MNHKIKLAWALVALLSIALGAIIWTALDADDHLYQD